MNTTPARKRATLKIVLAGVAIVGVGAAVTTAAWTDNVFFSAEATASSFDLQHSADGVAWEDDGVPGNDVVVEISAAGLDALSPGTTVNVPFHLCNVGATAGTITAVTTPVIVWPEAVVATVPQVTATVTAPIVTTALPASTTAGTCTSPLVGNLRVETLAGFPGAAQGTSGTITFTVTGATS